VPEDATFDLDVKGVESEKTDGVIMSVRMMARTERSEITVKS